MKTRNHRWIALLALALMLLALGSCAGHALPPAQEETPAPEALAAAATDPPVTEAPAPTETPEPTPSPSPTPQRVGPAVTAQPRVGDGFFEDTAFFGNSLVGGLRLFGKLNTATFFGVTNAAVYNVATTLNSTLSNGKECTMLEALGEKQYGKVYVLLGINELGFEPEYFAECMDEVLDEIAALEPKAELYLMSLTPITRERSEDDSVFTRERILAYNAQLYAMAERRGCWYVDLFEALAGPDGYLPAEISTDGIHLTRDSYPIWSEYLRTHYAPTADSEKFIEELPEASQ